MAHDVPKSKSINSLRQRLAGQGYTRAYEPWSAAEEQELLHCRLVLGQSEAFIARCFGRKPSAIRSRLDRLCPALDLPGSERGAKPDEISNHLQRILQGLHPITGECLALDSAWRHPAILSDISTILKPSRTSMARLQNAETPFLRSATHKHLSYDPGNTGFDEEVIESD